MFLIKHIYVDLGKKEVRVEDGLRSTNWAKSGQEPKYQLGNWPYLEIIIQNTENLEKDMTLDYVKKLPNTEVKADNKRHTRLKVCKKEDIIEGYIVTVSGMTPGSVVTLTGTKLEGLYPEKALVQLEEGQVFDFHGRLKISVQDGKLIVE